MQPSKAFSSRLHEAKLWRNGVEPDIKTALKFCAPGREYDFDSTSTKTRPVSENFTSVAEELAVDLAGDLVTYYTPAEQQWADMVVTTPVQQDQVEAVLELVKSRETDLFDMIQSSNYYDVAPQLFMEAAIHGTPAMWVDPGIATQSFYVETVPPHELLIAPGHRGTLDRFRVQTIKTQNLEATLSGIDVDLSHPEIKKKMEDAQSTVKLTWGFWLDWSDPAFPMWQMEITVDDKRVTDENMVLGPMAGACPLLVGRFNPWPGARPWGRGAGVRALPEILILDDIAEKVLDNLDAALDPAYTYPDDGGVDFQSGIQRGHAYPVNPNYRNTIERIDLGGSLDYGWFSEEKIIERLRAAFYQDGPRQRGDTPPTATQWIDEARRVQRRLGKPSAPLWSELILPFIQRVEYIGVLSGKLQQTITHNGKALSVTPVSPLQKAQNQDKVMVARSNLDLIVATAGEAAGQVVDWKATYDNIIAASGDELLVLRKEEANEPAPPAA